MSPDKPEPRPLEYHVPKSPYRRGATLPARIVAGGLCVFFVVLAIEQWRAASRGSSPLRAAGDVLVLLSLAASVFCLLVALGRIGRHKDGWI